ncbi:MAG: hypothetical protein IT243_06255 [Bacteroidia bacterium]|nr:hypothetical protein [Bacteroidia bacterium]
MKITKYIFLIVFSFYCSISNATNEDFEKSINSMPDNKEKVDKINNEVDRILGKEPTKEDCKKAKPLAHQAAKIAEKINYKTGMARSYEQLTLIYKILDYQLQYIKYKSKAAMIDRGEEMKKQEEQIKKQNEDIKKQNEDIEKQRADLEKQKKDAEIIKKEIANLSKDNIANKSLIQAKQNELSEKEKVLTETNDKLTVLNEEAEKLEARNKILEQETHIRKLELEKQQNQKIALIFILIIILIISAILFWLFRSKQNFAKELSKKNEIISAEKKISEDLLLNILPLETANELKETGKAVARDYEMVTVLFTDFIDFTIISESLTPKNLVDEIDMCYCAFDTIIEKYGIEKIKTIGDAYLCADGLSNENENSANHNPSKVIEAAFEIVDFMADMYEKRKTEGKQFFKIRVGIHSGPLVAGVVGKKKFAYDIWGDTVNTAARMEQNSEAGKINISSTTYNKVKDKYNFVHRGKINAKNKGQIDMYFIEKIV